jgi:putative membrane protein
MMHWSGEYGYGMGFGWIFMILFWGLLIFIIISLLRRGGAAEKESAEEILKKRYARGEISKEEFEHLRKAIRE